MWGIKRWISGILLFMVAFCFTVGVALRVPSVNTYFLDKALSYVSDYTGGYDVSARFISLNWGGATLHDVLLLKKNHKDTLLYAARLDCQMVKPLFYIELQPQSLHLYDVFVDIDEKDSLFFNSNQTNIKSFFPSSLRKISSTRAYLDISTNQASFTSQVLYSEWDRIDLFSTNRTDSLNHILVRSSSVLVNSYDVQHYLLYDDTVKNTSYTITTALDALQRFVNEDLAQFSLPRFPAHVQIEDLKCEDAVIGEFFNGEIQNLRYNSVYDASSLQVGSSLTMEGVFQNKRLVVDVGSKVAPRHQVAYDVRYGKSFISGHFEDVQDTASTCLLSTEVLAYQEDVSSFITLEKAWKSALYDSLYYQGSLEFSSDRILCRVDSSNVLGGLSLNGSFLYESTKRNVQIDSFLITFPKNYYNILQGHTNWLSSFANIPFSPTLSQLYIEGFVREDSICNLLMHSDRLYLSSRDTLFLPVVLEDYTIHLAKDSYTSHLWQVNQYIKKLKTPKAVYEKVHLDYYEQISDAAISIVGSKEGKRKSFSIHTLLNIQRGTKNWELESKGLLDGILLSDFFHTSFDGLIRLKLKTFFDLQVKQKQNSTDIHINFDQLFLFKKGKNMFLPSLDISFVDQERQQRLIFKEGENTLYTSMSFLSISQLLKRLRYHYESILKDPEKNPFVPLPDESNEYGEVAIDAPNISKWMSFFMPEFRLKSLYLQSRITKYQLFASLRLTNASYTDQHLSSLDAMIQADQHTAHLSISSDSLGNNNHLWASNIQFELDTKDRRDVAFSLSGAMVDANNHLSVQGVVRSLASGVMYLDMKKFKVFFGENHRWQLDKSMPTPFSGIVTELFPFHLKNDDQLFSCLPLYYKWQQIVDVQMNVENVEIDFLNMLLFDPIFILSGRAYLGVAIQGKIDRPVLSLGGKVNGLEFNGVALGDVDVYQRWEGSRIQFSAYDRYGAGLRIKSFIDLSPHLSYAVHIDVDKKPLSWLNYYTLPSIHSIEGFCSGKIDLYYDDASNDLSMDGQASVTNTVATVGYTNCDYAINKGIVFFDGQRISFNAWDIYDPLRSSLTGKLSLNVEQASSFDLIDMDVRLSTENLKIYDGNIQGQDNYKLLLHAGGNVLIRKRNKLMDIFCNLDVSDSSAFEIHNLEKRGDIFENSQIRMRAADVEEDVSNEPQNQYDLILQSLEDEEYINFNSELSVNDNLRVFFYADATNAQESINFAGDAQMSISSYDKLTVQIMGDYQVSSLTPFDIGLLTIQLDKTLPGFIRWNGDIDPQLDIYTNSYVEGVDFSSLYNSLGTLIDDNLTTTTNTNFRELRSDVNLNTHIEGTASVPDIHFDIVMPPSSTLQNSQNIRQFLSDFRSDQKFAKQQVGYLVLFNRLSNHIDFAQNGINPNSAIVGALSSITNYVLNKSIGKDVMQRMIDKIIPGSNIRFNINTNFSGGLNTTGILANSSFNESLIDKGNIDLSLSKGFFADRLLLSVGGSFDYFLNATGASAQTASNTQIYTSPYVDLRWKIKPKSNFSIGVYYKNTVDFDNQLTGLPSQQTSNITGMNIGFQKEVDSLKELFIRKRENRDSLPTSSNTGL